MLDLTNSRSMRLQATMRGSKGSVTRSDNLCMTSEISTREATLQLTVAVMDNGKVEYSLAKQPWGKGPREVLSVGQLS